ncbi:radical SAM protein [Micromonospora sp. DR5-3]|uniref:radical SAM protein n=1 Tax=unclassified Micromonospora TaxID=2617518 RepID=UPI0011DA3CC3|nr:MULTISPECIES: radical SAM protein [unclassified Micromonospora]MCW3817917.1 radical SAM protein [Micromonospora sp. DR5-3]TYC19256.1 radical SAM protein [Micromonospora sp. MP36]
MRILQGADGWWCLSGTRVAHLPIDAAVAATGDSPITLSAKAHSTLAAAGFFTPRPTRTYSLTVLSSTGCNLGCSYCFQNVHSTAPGNFAPERIALRRLDEPTIADIITFTRDAMDRAGLRDLKVLLFGGEPLLNPGGCLMLLEQANKIGMTSAEMVSNAVLLTPDLARELENRKLERIQVTFDGDQTTHDQIRTTRNGRGTFKTILANVSRAAEVTQLRWQFRINVSHRNNFSVPDLINTLAQTVDPSKCTINIAMINDVGIGYSNELRYSEDFREEYLSWHLAILDHGFSLPTPRAEFHCDYCSEKRGRVGAVVNADGTLYSSWETVGRPGMEVGSAQDGYLSDDIIDQRWHACGYNAAPHGDPQQAQAFHDRVDAAILDAMRERSALHSHSKNATASP